MKIWLLVIHTALAPGHAYDVLPHTPAFTRQSECWGVAARLHLNVPDITCRGVALAHDAEVEESF